MYLGADVRATTERRGSKAPVPPNIHAVLTQEQRISLNKVEDFGWQLAFVRQPLFQEPVTVIVSPDRERYAVLELDGEINLHPAIVIRH